MVKGSAPGLSARRLTVRVFSSQVAGGLNAHTHTIQRNKSRTTTPYSSILSESETPKSIHTKQSTDDGCCDLPRPCDDDVTSFHLGDEYHYYPKDTHTSKASRKYDRFFG